MQKNLPGAPNPDILIFFATLSSVFIVEDKNLLKSIYMKNKKIISLVVLVVVIALISFYAGSKYASGKNNSVQFAQNINSMTRGANGNFTGGQKGGMRGGGNVFGTILSKDANSITVELRAPNMGGGTDTQTAEGSKIVFYTDKTTVAKTVDGTLSDLIVGKDVSVSGTANPDGSVSATSIQLRTAPVAPAPVANVQ